MANLLEQYKNRLAVADRVYSAARNGEKITESRKIMTAKLLDNTSRFLREAFENSVGTQRADLGAWKKFALNLTNVVNPTLIAPDLVLTQPMSSFSGYIVYAKYTYGSNKGTTQKGTVINDPFKLGAVDPNFTAAIVAGEAKADATASTAYTATLNWKPVVAGKVEVVNATQTLRDFDGDGKLYIVVDGGKGDEAGTVDYATGAIAILAAKVAAGKVAVNYAYDNVTIPGNDIPTINVEMATIPLVAKARRVQIYYSQIAEYQAKQDYGFSLGDQLADKAAAQLAYRL